MADTFNKRFESGDVFIIPYNANKQWNITSSQFSSHNIFFQKGSYPTASNIKNYTEENLIYKSVLANFYPELYPTLSLGTSSYYQTNNYTSSLTSNDYVISGGLRQGNLYSTEKFFPTETSSFIYTINIPTSLYSTKVLPTTFEMNISGGLIYDDGEYNLRYSGSNQTSSIGTIISQSSYVGNLFYEQGLGVLTVIPNSIIPTSPPAPVTYESVAIWAEDYSGTSGATSNWRARFDYVDQFNNSASFELFNIPIGISPYGIFGTVINRKSGTGTWTTLSGTPLPLYTQTLSNFNPLIPNVT